MKYLLIILVLIGCKKQPVFDEKEQVVNVMNFSDKEFSGLMICGCPVGRLHIVGTWTDPLTIERFPLDTSNVIINPPGLNFDQRINQLP